MEFSALLIKRKIFLISNYSLYFLLFDKKYLLEKNIQFLNKLKRYIHRFNMLRILLLKTVKKLGNCIQM